jgi:hypothetical protein
MQFILTPEHKAYKSQQTSLKVLSNLPAKGMITVIKKKSDRIISACHFPLPLNIGRMRVMLRFT